MGISVHYWKLIPRSLDSRYYLLELFKESNSKAWDLRLVPIYSVNQVPTCGGPNLDRNHDSRFKTRAFTSSHGEPASSPVSIASNLSSNNCFCASVIGILDGSTTKLSQRDWISSSLSSTFRLSISIAGRDMSELYRASRQNVAAKLRNIGELTFNV